MKTLNREAFTVTQPILSLRVDVSKMSRIRSDPLIRGYLMDMPKTRQIIDDPEAAQGGLTKLLRLRIQSEDQLPQDVGDFIKENAQGLVPDQVIAGYDLWTACELASVYSGMLD